MTEVMSQTHYQACEVMRFRDMNEVIKCCFYSTNILPIYICLPKCSWPLLYSKQIFPPRIPTLSSLTAHVRNGGSSGEEAHRDPTRMRGVQ